MYLKSCKSYNTIDSQISFICENEYPYFLSKENVVGIGFGYKIVNGIYTCQKCIKVFVVKKVALSRLHSNDVIPTLYKGIPTDVYENGIITCSGLTSKIRPVLGGYSVGGIIGNQAGTLGCLVKRGSKKYMLSCNHVFAFMNRAKIGTPILQPAMKDGGSIITDTVAFLSKFVELKARTVFTIPENYTDCAIAELSDPSIASDEIALLGKIHGIREPKLNDSVQKVGKKTEKTSGKITSIDTTIEINYPIGVYLFKKQIVTTKMSDKGDSGSILCDHNRNAIGLLVGDGQSSSYFNYIEMVLKSLDVRIMY